MRGGSDAFNIMQKQTVAVAAPQETDYSLIYAPSPLFPHSREFGLVVLDSDFEKTKDFLTSDLDRRKCYKKKNQIREKGCNLLLRRICSFLIVFVSFCYFLMSH